MKQINYTYNNICNALDALHGIAKKLAGISPSNILFHIYLSGISKHQAGLLLEAADNSLPEIPRIGISEYQAYADKQNCLIKFNFIIADSSEFYSYQLPCERGLEKECAAKLLDTVKEIDNIRAIEICSANQLLDTSTFIETLGEDISDLPIFGSLSKPARLIGDTIKKLDDAFTLGKQVFSDGYTVAVYCGENLEVYLNYTQSWRPIGKEMFVRLVDNPILGSSGVYKIDNASAINTFHKYLGIPKDDTFIANAWYFPLIVNRNGINICFTPMGCKDDTLFFSGRLFEYEPVRFSYCTRDEILDASFAECSKIKKIAPDALIVITCCNRYAFMKDDENNILEYYRKCVNDFIYCHAYGEIAYKNMKGGSLNSALVSIAFRETAEYRKVEADFYTIPKIRKFRNSSIPISFIVSHFFHQMTADLLDYQNKLEDKVKKVSQENESLSLRIVQALTETIDAKDKYTNGHSKRVAEYAREIAKRYGYDKDELSEIYMIGLLHDVGKIGVPDYVINKKTKLSDDEFSVIKEHPVIGAHILNSIKERPNFVTGARWHHERYDGKGYPDGLKGKDIPEIARIIAVADAYDAMTSNRSYRDALSQKYVRFEIANGKNKQFDPNFADIMLQMIDNDTEYKLRETCDRSNTRIEGLDFTTSAIMSNYPEAALSMKISEHAEEGKHLPFSVLIEFGQNMPGGFFVYKAGGNEELLYINDIVLKIYGCKDANEFQQLTGNSFKGMVHEKDIDRIELSIIEQIETDEHKLDNVEYRIRRKDGEIRWVDDYGRLISTVEYGDVFYVLIRDITEEHIALEKLTDMDHLTKVYNRRHFDNELQKSVNNLMRLGGSLCLIMIDIDKFKQFNDLYGHFAGDKCLTQVAQAMQKTLKRKNDLLFRYGGEEFAVLLYGTVLEDACVVAEKLRHAVRNLGLPHEHGPCGIVTISAGGASLSGEDAHCLASPAAELIKHADRCLYEAKVKGRDSVVVNKIDPNVQL